MEREENYSFSNNLKEWKDIKIHGADFIIAVCATRNSWKIFLSNLVEIWTETIMNDIALTRCQSLNMLLDLDSFDIKDTLDKILSDVPKHATDKSVREIKLESCLDGITFKFNINLTKGTCLQFWNEIMKPLCQSTMELQRRHEIVIDLIKRKDEELMEYKLSGAELIRKNIETVPFNKDIFEDKTSNSNSKSDGCVNIFRAMMALSNELKSSASESTHSDPNPVDPGMRIKVENPETSERTVTVDVNKADEPKSKIKTETSTKAPSIFEIESIASRTRNIEENRVIKTKSSVNNPEINSRTEKSRKKRSTPKDIPLPLVSTAQLSKRPNRLKTTRNIYDYVS